MLILYSKPTATGISQGERIAYIRQLRMMTQDEVSGKLNLTGECKRRTMTRYEKGNRNPKEERVIELSKILQVNKDSIKKYDFKSVIDLIYLFLWLEEIFPNIYIEIPNITLRVDKDREKLQKFFNEWQEMKFKRKHGDISFYEYIDWKFNYEIKEEE